MYCSFLNNIAKFCSTDSFPLQLNSSVTQKNKALTIQVDYIDRNGQTCICPMNLQSEPKPKSACQINNLLLIKCSYSDKEIQINMKNKIDFVSQMQHLSSTKLVGFKCFGVTSNPN